MASSDTTNMEIRALLVLASLSVESEANASAIRSVASELEPTFVAFAVPLLALSPFSSFAITFGPPALRRVL